VADLEKWLSYMKIQLGDRQKSFKRIEAYKQLLAEIKALNNKYIVM
jgi:hypothetical protein